MIAAGKSDIRTSALAPLTNHAATRSGRSQVVSKPDQHRRQIHLEQTGRIPKRYDPSGRTAWVQSQSDPSERRILADWLVHIRRVSRAIQLPIATDSRHWLTAYLCISPADARRPEMPRQGGGCIASARFRVAAVAAAPAREECAVADQGSVAGTGPVKGAKRHDQDHQSRRQRGHDRDVLGVPFRTQHPLGVVVNRPSVWPDR